MKIARITGYFDASGGHGGIVKGRPSPAALIAGYFSTPHQWDKFTKEWNQLLADNGISHIHTTDLLAGSKLHKGWSEKQIEQLLGDALEITRKYVLYGVLQAVVFADYNAVEAMFPQAVKRVFVSPYFFCAVSVFNAGQNYAKTHTDTDIIPYVFENDDIEKEITVLRAHKAASQNEETRNFYRFREGTLTFAPKIGNPPLQAADMMANLWYKEAYRQAYNTEPFSRLELSILHELIPGTYEMTNKIGLEYILEETAKTYADLNKDVA